ncbi:MAG: nucleotidyltransferase domain-containing protein [Desulfurococcales archaeon]|nr:nucleotidyltransferase domain-containing protein [Desulfurococcales archaeon]
MSPIDGSIVVFTALGHVWTAISRGYDHPSTHIVAEPYRGPRCERAPPASVERRLLGCIQRLAPLVERRSVLAVYDPWRIASALWDRIPEPIRGLALEVGADMVGLTGSYAVGCEREGSDVDVVLYSRDPADLALRLREALRLGVIRQCSPERVISKRRGRPDYSSSLQHVMRSVTESCVEGVPYTLRILREPVGRQCEAWHARRIHAGRARLSAVLRSHDPDRILVPARYELEPLRASPRWILGERIILESFRTRYSDLESGSYYIEGEIFIEEDGTVTVSPDLWGGVWLES